MNLAKSWGFLLGCFFLLISACSEAPVEIKYRGAAMGTSWSVKVNSPHGYSVELADGIQAELDLVDRLMSNWKEDSDISRFNDSEINSCTEVSTLTLAVVLVAQKISELSHGAFDVTLSPLIELWGFGTKTHDDNAPDNQAVEETLQRIGTKHLYVRDSDLCKRDVPISVNLSALAKGYGVDRVASYLSAQGLENYLVEVGGELKANGKNARGTPWTIGIEQPADDLSNINIQAALPLVDSAVATSGDYRNYFKVDDARYSHILDSVTGYPVTHNAASVTVIKESSMEADAWATALLVLGPERGMAIANEQNLAVLMILRGETGFETLTSDQWPLN